MTDDDTRWHAIQTRDPAADGGFWYSVATTGIYCRPSCPSREARRGHVRFHASPEEARATGARACRRCNPDGASVAAQNAMLVAAACRTIEAAIGAGTRVPTLARLADAAQLGPAWFHRVFKAAAGLTPAAYAAAHRAARVRAALAGNGTTTSAIHDAGFATAARFYDQSGALLGMAPARYRRGGAGEVLRHAVASCTLGRVLVASSGIGVAAILLGEDDAALTADLAARFPNAALVAGDAGHAATVAAVVALIDAPGAAHDLPLDVRGTVFQHRVWTALRAIPPGRRATYGEIAAAIGSGGAVRAVASACAANPVAVAIPCHRVVRGDGALAGYRWGVERKRALLAAEACGPGEPGAAPCP